MNKYDIEINDENIEETITNDLVGNRTYISSVFNMLNNIQKNAVICIDGYWGSGKTILVKQIEYIIKNSENENLLKNFNNKDIIKNVSNNNLVFYYNAWENDDSESPFESIIYNILKKYPENRKKLIGDFNINDTVREAIKNVVKGVTNKWIGTDLSIESLDSVKTFDELADQINTMQEKKKAFRKLISDISKGKRMIFIIDELDRCNPIYAIKTLETIKHFYDMENITIIVSTNNHELLNIIKSQFGDGYDAYSYLNKFYHYIMNLDNNRSIDYCKKLLDFSTSTYIPHNVFYILVKKYKMSFRDCNRFRTLYDSAKKYIEIDERGRGFINSNQYSIVYCIILIIIFVFKIKDIEAYNRCLNGEEKDLKDAIEYIDEQLDLEGYNGWLWKFIDKPNEDEKISTQILKSYREFMKRYDANEIFMSLIKMYV